LNAERVGIMGFSAGGHLASTAATHFDAGRAEAQDPLDRLSCRPDFAILVYPVVTMGPITHGGSKKNLLGENPSAELIERFSNEKQVTERTPPMFLAHALDDAPVPPENSRLLFAALQTQKSPSKYLELPSGGHGLNGYKGPMWDAWQTQSLQWLADLKLIPAGEGLAASQSSEGTPPAPGARRAPRGGGGHSVGTVRVQPSNPSAFVREVHHASCFRSVVVWFGRVTSPVGPSRHGVVCAVRQRWLS
jgi:hypothetical protein